MEIEARQIHRNRYVIAAASTPWALLALLTVAALFASPTFLIPSVHLLIGDAMLLLYAWRKNKWPELRDVCVRASRSELVVGETRIPRESITRGVVMPHDDGVEVRLTRGRWPDVQLIARDQEEGRRVLRALGLDVNQTVATFTSRSRAMVGFGPRLLSGLATVLSMFTLTMLVASISAKAAPLGFLLGVTVPVVLGRPTYVHVGVDGLRLSWLGRVRSLSYAAIGTVRAGLVGGDEKRRCVRLHLRRGEVVVLPMGTPAFDGGNAEALASRILTSVRDYREGRVDPDEWLGRGGRTHGAWVRALRQRRLADHRTAAVPADALFRVIEDAASDPVDRAAAAIALGRELTSSERGRLRDAAQATASPKLRVLLEGAGNLEEETLAEELGALENETAKRRRSQGA